MSGDIERRLAALEAEVSRLQLIVNAQRQKPLAAPPNGTFDSEPSFRRFWERARQLCPQRLAAPIIMQQMWASVVISEAIAERVFTGMRAWEQSDEWRKGFFMRWEKWIEGLYFERPPKPVQRQTAAERIREAVRR